MPSTRWDGRGLKLRIRPSSVYRKGLVLTSCYHWFGAADGVGGFFADQHRYTGGFDFALVPRGVSEKEVAGHIRVGFVHHWSGMSKDEYAAALQSQVLCCACSTSVICIVTTDWAHASATLLPLMALILAESHLLEPSHSGKCWVPTSQLLAQQKSTKLG